MTITQNGNSFTWTGTVTVTNATDLSTGVATLILTPSGGIGNLPVLAQGTPGLPPVFDSVNVTTLSPGSSATASWITNSSGGAGIASHYTLQLGIPAGASGYSLNATQTVYLTGSPTGGTFTLTYAGQTTSAIPYNASAGTVQSALAALSTVGSGNVTVAGSGPWVIAFSTALGAVSTMSATSSLTGGSVPNVTVQGNYTIAGASDMDTVTNPVQDQYTIKWQASESKFKFAAQLAGQTLQGTLTSYTGNNSLQSLGHVDVAAQPFSWIPDVRGFAIPGGTANTQVDLVGIVCSTVNGTTVGTGQQVAYGKGKKGSLTSDVSAGIAPSVRLDQAFGGTLSSGYGVVPAGTSATVHFAAKQVAATSDSYTVSATGAYFSVKIDPVPGTN